MSNNDKFYSSQKLLSYNAFLNFVMSGRGTGKSFEAKKIVIRNWEKDKSQSVYVRRTKVELKAIKDTYWNDISIFYPQYEFEVKGYTGYINDEPVVHFIPLSTSTSKKSSSYPLVKYIIFDEYIITKTTYNRYLNNEMTLLFDLIETVFRSRDNCRVLLLANSVSYVNPLFSFFDIEPKNKKRFNTYKNGLICVEIFESKSFIEDKVKTKFAQLIKGTIYSDYAIGNETLEDNTDFICDRYGQLVFVSSFKSEGFEVGVWLDNQEHRYFVDERIDTTNKNRYAILLNDVEPNIFHVKDYRNLWRVKEVKKAYNNANLFFSTQEVKKFMQNNVLKYL